MDDELARDVIERPQHRDLLGLPQMRDSSLVRVLQRQSNARVGLVALPTVAEGGAAIMRRLAELEEEGFGAAIVDAVFERNLEAVDEAAARGPVSLGASGLGLGLARAFTRGRGADAGAALGPVSGLAAALVGRAGHRGMNGGGEIRRFVSGD